MRSVGPADGDEQKELSQSAAYADRLTSATAMRAK
jgi:hypothetical protein